MDRRASVENSKPVQRNRNPPRTYTHPETSGRIAKRRQKSGVRRLPRQGLDPASKATLNSRVRPYGFASYYETFKAAQSYTLESVAAQIRCPVLIANPANEQYWPGQSQRLYNLVTSTRKLVHFSESDSADLQCEPQGTNIRDQRVFNWLDEALQ
ncbi:MAG: hypothetical protein WA715_05760 [Candidatus Acidiferrum sp.]